MPEAATRHHSAVGPPSWSGWGPADEHPPLPRHIRRGLARRLGPLPHPRPPVGLHEVRLPPSRLDATARSALATIVGARQVRQDRLTRVLHAGGKSYLDLLDRRDGDAGDAPDAVVVPGSHDEVQRTLAVCAREQIAVVPFGGGTSVVGGVEPLRGRFPVVVSLDLSRLDRVSAIDRCDRLVTLEAGLRGAEAERLLGGHGLTIGHFPQSFEQATIGGFVATRSAGQASTGYGRIDDLVAAVRVATPVGTLALGRPPASAAGPDLLGLLVGSEGTLGVVTEATLHARPAPGATRYEGFSLPSFDAGVLALRALAQEGAAPDVLRLSDEPETELALAQAEPIKAAAVRSYLRARGQRNRCLVITGVEGEPGAVTRRHRAAARILRAHGGIALGSGVGSAWRRERFSSPFVRDTLLDHGLLVETLETAAPWSRLTEVYQAIAAALSAALAADGAGTLVSCHVSHVYPAGASLYFTVLARRSDDPARQWLAAKEAANTVILATGCTITHHHAVGTAHRSALPAEVGELGVATLRAVKDRLDPEGIMNPGKLLAAGAADP